MGSDATVQAAVASVVKSQPEDSRWVVAFSGGRDSTVLLHALKQHTDLAVRAVFVDHGLQPAVRSQWLAHVRSATQALGTSLVVLDASSQVPTGESLEAHARQERYRLLAENLAIGEILVTAQHADDQAETVLLQLLRGAGPSGLSAMPRIAAFGRGILIRPLIHLETGVVESHATTNGLEWFDDPSNLSTRFDRNYLRHEVMPNVHKRWPSAANTLGRAAGWQRQAANALARQALADWQAACQPLSGLASCERLAKLPDTRVAEALRAGIRGAGLTMPSASRLQSIVTLTRAASGKGLVGWEGGSARRYRDRLYLLDALAVEPTGFQQAWDGRSTLVLPQGYGAMCLLPEPAMALELRCHFREPGLRVCEVSGHSKSFAQWCQERAIAPWMRSRIPLLSASDELVAIGGKRLSGWHKLGVTATPSWIDSPELGLSANPGSGIV
ncbi:MAG: tRNA lysidine(34) synthetase TilS [Pseudomonadota bacterium]